MYLLGPDTSANMTGISKGSCFGFRGTGGGYVYPFFCYVPVFCNAPVFS